MSVKLSPSSIGPTGLWPLLPGRTDRALFLGQTGSGKTTLARHLLARRKYVVVYDGKGLLKWYSYKVVENLDGLLRLDPVHYPRIIYQPVIEEMHQENLNAFFQFIYQRRNTTLYVDEVYSCIQEGIPDYYLACITRGRERNIEVWNSVQRPASIPLSVLTESEHVYVFRLVLDEDRMRVRALTGLDKDRMRALNKHEFYYIQSGEAPEGPLRLKLFSSKK